MSQETKQAPGRDPLVFDTLGFSDGGSPPSRYFLYFYQEGDYQVAVVFRVDAAGGTVTDQSMDYSLKSLAVGPAVRQRRQSLRPSTR